MAAPKRQAWQSWVEPKRNSRSFHFALGFALYQGTTLVVPPPAKTLRASSPCHRKSLTKVRSRKSAGAKEAAEKSGDGWKCVPQRLKPHLFSIVYVRAEARTLQRTEFFRSL
jgi:hypothetical protein